MPQIEPPTVASWQTGKQTIIFPYMIRSIYLFRCSHQHVEEGIRGKILACLLGRNNHGRQFLLPVGKLDKPGKYFAAWLYETEDQDLRNFPGKRSGRELLAFFQIRLRRSRFSIKKDGL